MVQRRQTLDRDLESRHFLKASLSFSPACLTLPFTWSALPSARSLSLPLTLPTVSFSFPFACWAVFFALSLVAMVGLLVLGCEKRDEPSVGGLHTGSPVFSARCSGTYLSDPQMWWWPAGRRLDAPGESSF